MAVRDFNWVDIPFGFFIAGIVVVVSMTIAAMILTIVLGFAFSEVADLLIVVAAAALAVGMLVLLRLYPGPDPMIERPLRALAAFMALPLLTVILTILGVLHLANVPWYLPILLWGFFPSLVIGFAVFFAIFSEAGRHSQPKRSWPLVRPAGSQGGIYAIPRGQAKVFAGLERGGPEEERPDTFVRMKTKD